MHGPMRSHWLVATPRWIFAFRTTNVLVVRAEVLHGFEAPVNRAVVILMALARVTVRVDIHSLTWEVPTRSGDGFDDRKLGRIVACHVRSPVGQTCSQYRFPTAAKRLS